jgi:tetratricopeptide (TPR) repeat protein
VAELTQYFGKAIFIMSYKIILILFILLTSTSSSGYSESGSTLFDNGITEFQKGRYQDAVFWFSKLIEKEPFNAKAYKNRGVARLSLQKYDMDIEGLNSALNPDPQPKEISGNLGPAWHYKEEYKKVMDDFNSALNLDPELEGIHSNMGVAWYYAREYKKAIAEYGKEIEKHPENYSAFFNRAISWVELKEYENALRDLNSVLSIKPDEYWAIAYQGDIYAEANNPVLARESYLAAMALNTGNNYVHDKLLLLDDKVAASTETEPPQSFTKESEKTETPMAQSVSQPEADPIKTAKAVPLPVATQPTKQVEIHGASPDKRIIKTPALVQHSEPADAVTSTESSVATSGVLTGVPMPGKKKKTDHDKFTIQMGAFLNSENAYDLIKTLYKKGYEPRVLTIQDKKNRQWSLVRTGVFQSADLAKETLEKVKKDLKAEAVIRPMGRF